VAETWLYPSLTLNAVKNHHGREPVYGYTNKQPARLYMSLEPKPFLTEFKDYVNKCRFRVYHLLLRDEFLPTTPFDSGAIIKAIQECKQSYYDTKTRQFVKQSVQQFGNQFESKLSSWPSDMPYPHDFPVIFWQNLDAAIHDEARTMLPDPYVPPPKPAGEKNHQADD
jgi:hypothetical protein